MWEDGALELVIAWSTRWG